MNNLWASVNLWENTTSSQAVMICGMSQGGRDPCAACAAISLRPAHPGDTVTPVCSERHRQECLSHSELRGSLIVTFITRCTRTRNSSSPPSSPESPAHRRVLPRYTGQRSRRGRAAAGRSAASRRARPHAAPPGRCPPPPRPPCWKHVSTFRLPPSTSHEPTLLDGAVLSPRLQPRPSGTDHRGSLLWNRPLIRSGSSSSCSARLRSQHVPRTPPH